MVESPGNSESSQPVVASLPTAPPGRPQVSGEWRGRETGHNKESETRNPLKRAVTLLVWPITTITGPWTRKNLFTWLALIAAVLVIRWCLIETYFVPTGSMEPTLHGDPRFLRGDRLGVNKLIYGPRVPFVNKRLLHFAEPKRWDIVVFRTVEENAVHKTLVKRVVGLPGERIHIADGTIWVNGQRVEPPEDLRSVLYYTTTLAEDEQNLQRFVLGMAKTNAQSPLLNPNNSTAQNYYADLARIRERLGKRDPADVPPEEARALLDELRVVSRGIAEQLYSAYLAARYPLRYGMLPDDEYALVPENCYLVCGDNSGESVDGRFFGWLPNDHILGRAFCIMWPPGRCRDLTGFSKTWWGKGLLLGLPALIIGIEIASVLRKRAHRAGNVAQPPSAV